MCQYVFFAHDSKRGIVLLAGSGVRNVVWNDRANTSLHISLSTLKAGEGRWRRAAVHFTSS